MVQIELRGASPTGDQVAFQTMVTDQELADYPGTATERIWLEVDRILASARREQTVDPSRMTLNVTAGQARKVPR